MTKQVRRPASPSKALSDLKGKTLKNITTDDYDKLVSNAFLEESNENFLKDISMIASSKQSPSGSMAGSSKIVVKAFTDTGDETVFQPSLGEVWILQEISVTIVTISSTTVSIGLEAGGNSMQASSTVTTAANRNYNSAELAFPNTTFSIDENTKITISKTGSFSEIGIFLHLVRVR